MVIPVTGSKSKFTPATHKKTLIRVLHVDDEQGLLKTTKQILESIGSFQVETALSVKEATKRLEEREFDVIISDYQMPEKNGLDFLRELRENGNTVPLILFTGKGREEVAIEALNLGASLYCNKMGKPQTVYRELAYDIQQVFEKKKAEEALQQEREMLEVVTQNVGAGLALISRDYRILWANKLLTEIFGEVKGKTCYKKYHNRTSVCPRCGVKEIFETGKERVAHTYEMTDFEGQKIWIDIISTPIRDEKGNVTAVLELSIDVTQRKKAEEQLRESEEKYRKQFEEALDAIFVADAETGILLDCNRAATKLVGRKKSEIIGKHQRILHPPEEIEGEFSKTYNKHIKEKEGKALETQVVTKSGERKDVAIKASILEVGGKILLQRIFRDITECKRLESALQESEEKFRLMLEQAPDLIVMLDEKGIVTSCNAALERGTDYSQDEIIGKHFTETPLLHGIDPSHAQKLFTAIIEEKHPEPIELTWFLKDGTPRISEIRVGLMKKDDKIAGFTAIARDITERKLAEEAVDKMVNDLSMVIEKLNVVGKLTRHDARNKLSVIVNNLYLARQRLTDDPKSLEYLDDIEEAIDQVEELFAFARTYEMLGAEELSYMDVEKSVNEATMLFSGLEGAKLVNECRGLTVIADSLLRKIFYNLVDDSLKHGEKITQIRVYYKVEKDQLKLVYEDDGVGIPDYEKEKIFNEGYGKGTGYGLYLIQKICEAYGWTIKETGRPGKGAQFTMVIPKTDKNGKMNYQIQ